MMKRTLCGLLTFLFCICFSTHAQPPATVNSADIYLQLKKLNVLGSVLYIAAHPDDENTRLLAYLSKEKLYRTGYLSLTRGDGGQNLIGNEQGIELGLIRTQELLAARRIDGAEQFFSRAYDFGYSKTADETMRMWNREKILSDVVWVIRNFQPDVIITRFPGDERAGHGHHTASALLANEAFKAAADPKRFPEQLQFVQPWQAKIILWNTFNFGGNNTTSEDQLKIDVGTYNPLLGKGCGEIASESRSQHKSQGFGVPRQRGVSYEYFLTTGGDSSKADLMADVVTNWSRLKGKEVQSAIDKLISTYSFKNPAASVPALVALYRQINNLDNSYWKAKKLAEVQQLIEECSGLFAEASTANEYAVQGDSLKVTMLFNKRLNIAVTTGALTIAVLADGRSYKQVFQNETNKKLPTNDNVTVQAAFVVPADASPSQPYWLQNGMPNGAFNVTDQQLIGKAESDAAFTAKVSVEIEGETFTITRPVQYKHTDPVKGELLQPIVILPRVSVQASPSLLVLNNKNEAAYDVRYTANTAVNQVDVSRQEHRLFNDTAMMQANEDRVYTAFLKWGVQSSSHHSFTDTFTTDNKVAVYPINIHYDHIPNITYFKPATQKVAGMNVKLIGKSIGYITGAGDKVPEALIQLGYNVTYLGEADITSTNLQRFDAVITGVRAYNVQDWLTGKYNTLMNYVRNGGNLIVQYNTNNQLGSISTNIGPYPFTITRTRVADETAPVKLTLPEHSALNYPNKITAKDFEGWVQERSIYQAEKLDTKYAAPLTMNDPNETPSTGSLIIAKYGKGNFVYTGLVFFRELPAGVEGAYKLFANLVALPKNNP